MSEKSPESFHLDHTAVAAPFVRIASEVDLPGGSHVTKYDVRFCQPNIDHLPMPAVHSIEHSLALTLRRHSDDVIDFSPMGCQTGFYATVAGPTDYDGFCALLETSLRDALELDAVPAATVEQCGFAASHDLVAAQQAIRSFLAKRREWGSIFTH